MPDTYELTPKVACQLLDGEAILIHFDSGRYYSCDGTGADVLDALQRGMSVEAINQALMTRYGMDDTTALLRRFLTLLEEEALIRLAAGRAFAGEFVPQAAEFSPPRLEKHTDLEELLKLDPIHDVDDAGWPLARSRDLES